jgi:hypothetical protein
MTLIKTTTIALAAAASLGAFAITTQPAAAHGWHGHHAYHYGYHGHRHYGWRHRHWGPRYAYGYYGGGCYWAHRPWGPVRVCY